MKYIEKIRFEDTIIPVVPIKELIKMKESLDRQQDRANIFYLKKSWRIGKMKAKSVDKVQDAPLLYYKTKEDIESYRKKPIKLKLQWLRT